MALIEKNVDRAASALFAVAVGYAAYSFVGSGAPRAAEAAAAAAVAYLLSIRFLSAIQPASRRLPVPVFDVRHIGEPEPPELLLTDRFEEPSAAAEEPLILDDILADLGPDSRVVRLFDPATMPTPGQLNASIDRHLQRDLPKPTAQDASQALHDALAELRRSLR